MRFKQPSGFLCYLSSVLHSSTCGLLAMTPASHAEGRQFDPGQVYFPSRAVSRTRSRNRLGGAAGIEPTQKNPIGLANSTPCVPAHHPHPTPAPRRRPYAAQRPPARRGARRHAALVMLFAMSERGVGVKTVYMHCLEHGVVVSHPLCIRTALGSSPVCPHDRYGSSWL